MSPIISIITINLNNANGLLRTIKSVLNQTDKRFQFTVIDGGSTDNSLEHLEEYKQYFHYWISVKDKGIYDAMNKGIMNSTGQYCLFLNSGDWLINNDVVKHVLPYLSHFDVISGNLEIYHNGKWEVTQSEEKLSIFYFLR